MAAQRNEVRHFSKACWYAAALALLANIAYAQQQNSSGTDSPNVEAGTIIDKSTHSTTIINNNAPVIRESGGQESCANSVYYYARSEQPRTHVPENVWHCGLFKRKRVSADLDSSTLLLVDTHRVRLVINWIGTSVAWANTPPGDIVTIQIRNPGPVSVNVRSQEILRNGGKQLSLYSTVGFFSKEYTLGPGDQLLVPVATLDALARAVDSQYEQGSAAIHYEPALLATDGCIRRDDASCLNIGFPLMISFADIFGIETRQAFILFLQRGRMMKPE